MEKKLKKHGGIHSSKTAALGAVGIQDGKNRPKGEKVRVKKLDGPKVPFHLQNSYIANKMGLNVTALTEMGAIVAV